MCVSPSLKEEKRELARRDSAARPITQKLDISKDLSTPEPILRSFLLDVRWRWEPFLSEICLGQTEDEYTGRGAVMPWQPITFMPVVAQITLGIHGSGSTLILLAVLWGGENAIRHTHFIHEEAAFEATKSSVPR